jgi:hypothetical protein
MPGGTPASTGAELRGGGTSVAGAPVLSWPLVLGVGILVAGIGLAATLLLLRRSPAPGPAPPAEAEAAAAPGERGGAAPAAPVAPAEGEQTAAGEPHSPELDRGEVLSELNAEVKARRLWATVEVDLRQTDVLIIRSAYCSEPGLKEAVEAVQSRLQAVGIRTVQCAERHGTVVFEQQL